MKLPQVKLFSSSRLITPQRIFSSALFCVVLTLAGCGGTPRSDVLSPAELDAQTSERVRELIVQAQQAESPEKDQAYLEAADLLLQANEVDWSRNLLASIDPDVLFNEDFVKYTLLYSRIAIDQDAPFLAQRILTNPRVEQQWNSLSPEAAQTLRARRAELFALLGESNDSIEERISLSQYLLTDEEKSANQDAIWRSLMSLPQSELERLSAESSDRLLQGWYGLAAISKNNEADLELQQAEIDAWMSRWPDHPATTYPPSDLQLLRQLVENQPRQVALLLPLEGNLERSGKAVRDGFMAAYYEAKNRDSRVPEVRIFDTSNGNIDNIYQLAVDDGAEFIVGPLEKENVAQLNLRLNLPVPTLALNEVDNAFGYPEGLYQFGLGPEDEAKQVARRAWLEGHRTAMLLIEQAGDAGTRAADTFISVWTELGGTVVNQTYFDTGSDYNQIVQAALLVNDSQERRRALQRLLGKPLEFQARRRHDVDMIFLFARPETARQIKPTLAFHDAAILPVYATRRVYLGGDNLKNDRDLNEIRFSTLPWLFNSQCPQKEAIVKHAKPSDSFSHLYALGVDAYRLYPRLPQLEQINGAKFYGCTGALQLLESRKIEREQVWAKISDGRAVPLPTVVSEAIIE